VYSTSEYEHEYSSIVSVCILPVNIAPVIIVPMGILPMSIVPVGTVLLRTSVSSSKYYTVYISTSPLPPLPPLPLHIPPITSYHTLGIPVRLHIRLHTNTHHRFPRLRSQFPAGLPPVRKDGRDGLAGDRPGGDRSGVWITEWVLGLAQHYCTASRQQQPHNSHIGDTQPTANTHRNHVSSENQNHLAFYLKQQ